MQRRMLTLWSAWRCWSPQLAVEFLPSSSSSSGSPSSSSSRPSSSSPRRFPSLGHPNNADDSSRQQQMLQATQPCSRKLVSLKLS